MRRGRGVQEDLRQAVALYERAAQLGSAMGQCNLGVLCRSGAGPRATTSAPLRCFRQRRSRSIPARSSSFGLSYEAGRGVEKDEKKAAQMYALAAEQEYPDGERALGRLL